MPCHCFCLKMTLGVGASISYQAAPDPSEARRFLDGSNVQRWSDSDHSMVADVGWKTEGVISTSMTGCDMVWYHPTSSVNLVFNHLTMIQLDPNGHQCRYPLPPVALLDEDIMDIAREMAPARIGMLNMKEWKWSQWFQKKNDVSE